MTIRIDGTNTSANPGVTGADADTGLQFGTNEVKIITDGTDRVTVDSSGRLLLGTTTEGNVSADNLTIADSAHSGLTIRSGTSSQGSIYFSDATTGAGEYAGYMRYDHNFSNFAIGTVGVERLRINSGNLLVGTSNAYDGEASNLVVASASNTGITVASTGNNNRCNLYFADGTSGTDASKGGFTYDHANDSLVTRTNGSERLRVLSGGGLTFNGDTAQANALDDYEEGTFSPTVTAGYTSVSYANQSGWYTKCGRTVVISGRVQFSGTANAAQITLGGLPFAQSTVGSTYGGGGIPYATVPEITGTSPYVSASSNVVFYVTGTGGPVNSSSNISSKWISFVVSIATT